MINIDEKYSTDREKCVCAVERFSQCCRTFSCYGNLSWLVRLVLSDVYLLLLTGNDKAAKWGWCKELSRLSSARVHYCSTCNALSALVAWKQSVFRVSKPVRAEVRVLKIVVVIVVILVHTSSNSSSSSSSSMPTHQTWTPFLSFSVFFSYACHEP